MRFKSCLNKKYFRVRNSLQMEANVKSVEEFLEENMNVLKARLVYQKTKFWKKIPSKGRMITGSRLMQKSTQSVEKKSTEQLSATSTKIITLPINTTKSQDSHEIINVEKPISLLSLSNETLTNETGGVKESDYLLLQNLTELTNETDSIVNETLNMDSISLNNTSNSQESFKGRKLLSFGDELDDAQTTMESQEFDVNDQSYQDRDIAVDRLAKSIQKRSRQQIIENEIQSHLAKKSFMRFGHFANRLDRSSYLKPVLELAPGNGKSPNDRLVSLSEFLNRARKKIKKVAVKPITTPSFTTSTNIPHHQKISSSSTPKTKITRVTTKNNLLQTYIISQTKIPPTKFESLNNFMTKKMDEKRFKSSIDEHNLIDCKDNDFGLECSCSITLSPPKCKKLINSFLSSCRILGCQNNGMCINMTANFPSNKLTIYYSLMIFYYFVAFLVPYVCSCPSEYMGTYCEIERDLKFLKKEIPEPSPTRLTKSKFFKTPASRTSSKLIMPKNFYHIQSQLCEPNPCLNNAVCKVHSNAENITFECICPNPFFHGKFRA